MNRDVAEVNGSNPPMLPGSFLYEKETGYEARRGVCVAAVLLTLLGLAYAISSFNPINCNVSMH